jgi:TPR repeat protein
MLRRGTGGPVDADASIRAFEVGCAADDSSACVGLGIAHSRGAGDLPADRERASELFATACRAGHALGCENERKLASGGDEGSAKPGWSTQIENLSFRTGGDPSADAPSRWTTKIGSMTIGAGSETATFGAVQSTCGMFSLTAAFGTAAASVRGCLGESDSRRVSLRVEAGKLAAASAVPDDEVGRCVTHALGRAHLGTLTCVLETTVSR